MSAMIAIADDPIIACMMRTGYPPWMRYSPWEEEDPYEHDDYWSDYEPDLEGEEYEYL